VYFLKEEVEMDLGRLHNDETATLAFTSNEKRVNLKKIII